MSIFLNPGIPPAGVGGSHTHSRTRANGGVISTPGSEFDGYATNWAILEILAKPPNEAILDLRDPQNRTRDHDSIPKGPKISSYGPFSSHFVRILDFLPNRAKSEPSNLGGTWLWILAFFFNGRPWILKVPKRPRKRHFWIAELRSFKMC